MKLRYYLLFSKIFHIEPLVSFGFETNTTVAAIVCKLLTFLTIGP